jgi:hypothetical protein
MENYFIPAMKNQGDHNPYAAGGSENPNYSTNFLAATLSISQLSDEDGFAA